MAPSLIPDPLQLCRAALTKLENRVNAFAAEKMDSDEFARALNQYSKVSLGLQYLVEKSLTCVFERMDLPRRSEVQALASAVQRVEDKLDQLLPAGEAVAARPPRTRRPLDIVPEQALAEAQARVKRSSQPSARRARQEH
ncbi:hypothetical protein JQX08_17585 [Pseudomonas sp. UL073]|uniref:Uncharacterized protein n=1 Tax=Zestomonas insulae TaxID=2809017 RepID=A0ABS2IK42_9GAMM|nr:hypothetical protein [Pseudomonas insulae]MBM7062528.1 hypothetical protein [Pseudomonas insulae]